MDAPDNKLRVPAGTDYSVTCSSEGRPAPRITWQDAEGRVVSEGPVLTVKDLKTTQDLKCVAENEGGREEQDFQIYVAGPGDAPQITNIHAHKPRTIEVRWDPPKIPNGEITRYIVYYTPLDDQVGELVRGTHQPAGPGAPGGAGARQARLRVAHAPHRGREPERGREGDHHQGLRRPRHLLRGGGAGGERRRPRALLGAADRQDHVQG